MLAQYFKKRSVVFFSILLHFKLQAVLRTRKSLNKEAGLELTQKLTPSNHQ
jgi:hypothetical protein